MVELLDVPNIRSIFDRSERNLSFDCSLSVEGLTSGSWDLTNRKLSKYVRNPQLYVSPLVYRPIEFTSAAVQRPGFYYLSEKQSVAGNNVQNQNTETSLNEFSTVLQAISPH